ncbi:MAG: NAD(P)/FAD-dependent oxidoreductase [Gammaproteobacteria bacterium]|nr:NAD(P)/FAD-dependent oxidoreductase [Gammaproteobacteria bacterium]
MEEIAIVGAGVAGLTAATYLGRFRRAVVVFDGGPPRARLIPESHNTPGFPQGIGGTELLVRLRAQAERYGARMVAERVNALGRTESGFIVRSASAWVRTPFVILASGILDRVPAIAGLDEAIERGVVRLCPVCDAYEAIDKRIAVLADEAGAHQVRFLRRYSAQVTWLRLHAEDRVCRGSDATTVVEISPDQIELRRNDILIRRAGQATDRFDCLYLALGCTPQAQLARDLGAQVDEAGQLIVSAHQETSVRGVFAAGDVVRGLNQIAVACGEAAIAATAIHNRLDAGAA